MVSPVVAYAPDTTYTWDVSTPNYNEEAVIHPETIDTECLVMGDFLGISPTQPNAPGYGDSGVSVGWDDAWVGGVGDPNTNGDDLDGLWAQIVLPSEGWWDFGFETDRVVVFLSQDHGPYLAEGLETRVYGSNDLWGAVGALAVLTDVYLDGWRTHNLLEDSNSNGWCSDDIAGVYELDGMYRYVKIGAWSPYNALNEPEVDAIGAVRVLEKTLSEMEGDLGDTVHVTVTVSVAPGETAEFVDTLPSGLTYIEGTFTLDDACVMPTDTKGEISYTVITAGTHEIEFDVKVDEAKNWEPMEVCNVVTVSWFEGCELICTMDADACFTIHPFETLRKYVGLPKADVVFSFDLTGSMGGAIGQAKSQATQIIADLQTLIADVAFGVVTHVDYPHYYSNYYGYSATYGDPYWGDYAYKTNLDITESGIAATTAINAMSIHYGGDGPQNYARVLYETQFLSWRPDATKIVVMFGDNIPHDDDFWSSSTGGDPGQDEIAYTPDDLDFQTVIASLASQDIVILSINCAYEWSAPFVQPFYQYLADETGGQSFILGTTGVSDAIYELVKAEAEESLTIKEKTETQWSLVIEVTNPYGYTMNDVVIKDRFGGEIQIDEEVSISHGTWSFATKGKSEKVFLTWDIGALGSGETARLILLVSTDLNPAGKQEYTKPGVYDLNSGATLKFIDNCGIQLSAYTNSIIVTVLPEDDP
ncbi:MAG: vWA domain-containing protein [Candidatus Thorarchaeota archaeon]